MMREWETPVLTKKTILIERKTMSEREEQRIRALVYRTLLQMLESEEHGNSPENVYLFAVRTLDFPVTQEEVEGALRWRLGQAFHTLPLEEYVADDGDDVLRDLRKALIEQGIDHPLAEASDFGRVPWEQYSYASLQAIYEVLYYYGAPNFFYEGGSEAWL